MCWWCSLHRRNHHCNVAFCNVVFRLASPNTRVQLVIVDFFMPEPIRINFLTNPTAFDTEYIKVAHPTKPNLLQKRDGRGRVFVEERSPSCRRRIQRLARLFICLFQSLNRTEATDEVWNEKDFRKQVSVFAKIWWKFEPLMPRCDCRRRLIKEGKCKNLNKTSKNLVENIRVALGAGN